MKKGDICWVEDYQEFGGSIVELVKRHLTNVEGGKLDYPIWDCYLLANNYPGLMRFYTEDSETQCHLILIREPSLKVLESESDLK